MKPIAIPLAQLRDAMELYGPFARQNHARNEQGTVE